MKWLFAVALVVFALLKLTEEPSLPTRETYHLGVFSNEVRSALEERLPNLPKLKCGPSVNYRSCGGFTDGGLQVILAETYASPNDARAFRAGFSSGVAHAVNASAAASRGDVVFSDGVAVCATALHLLTGDVYIDHVQRVLALFAKSGDGSRQRYDLPDPINGYLYASLDADAWECGVLATARE